MSDDELIGAVLGEFECYLLSRPDGLTLLVYLGWVEQALQEGFRGNLRTARDAARRLAEEATSGPFPELLCPVFDTLADAWTLQLGG